MTAIINIDGRLLDTSQWKTPEDRIFRNAWKADGTSMSIDVDMVKAREIWRTKIRAARVPELQRLDTEFMKALETGANTAPIIAAKQLLRDAPSDPVIEAATTPEELMLVQPAGLKVV
jgi:hypothetical protein